MARSANQTPGASPAALAGVFHHRWAVPVLAELQRGRGAKFVTLIKRLGVGRDTLSRTLKALDERGWAMRHAGHGHPMRPEYVLTPSGQAMGPACLALYDRLVANDLVEVALKKWSVPVLVAMGHDICRFQDLTETLPSVTARALTQSLKALIEAGLVSRTLLEEYPPRPVYRLSPAGKKLLPLARRLAAAMHK